MEAGTAGRKLGIGLRLAAKAMRTYAEQATSTPHPTTVQAQSANRTDTSGRTAPTAKVSAKAKGVARGAKRFGEAVWGPMAHTGGVLWLEITGLFFVLFALFFGQNVYKFRYSYLGGPDHVHFLVYAAFTVLFAWFALSSFYKARRKEKKNRERQAAR
jgi:hypothetical protein